MGSCIKSSSLQGSIMKAVIALCLFGAIKANAEAAAEPGYFYGHHGYGHHLGHHGYYGHGYHYGKRSAEASAEPGYLYHGYGHHYGHHLGHGYHGYYYG